MRLSVVIVSYQVKDLLHQCLCSVERAIDGIDADILVVDNASTDGTVDMVKQWHPSVKLIASQENLGFGKANNLAVSQSDSEHILFLNPDTVLPEDNLTEALAVMDADTGIGSMGCRMIDGAGEFLPESKRGMPTPMIALYRLIGLSKLWPKHASYGRYYWGHLPEDENGDVDVHCGAWMWVRKEILDKLGGFDESFFMYGEDIDLSYRIQRDGWRNHYLGRQPIIHYKGESTKHASWNYVKTFYQAMHIFAVKHFSNKASLFVFTLRMGIIARGALSMMRRFTQVALPPLIDAGLTVASMWLITDYWETNHRYIDGGAYPDMYRQIIIPAYQGIWLAGLWVMGGYRQHSSLRSIFSGWAAGTLLLMGIYALLPEELRFSRALLLLGAATFLLVTLLRRFIQVWWSGTRDAMLRTGHVGDRMPAHEQSGINFSITTDDIQQSVDSLQLNQLVFYPSKIRNKSIIQAMIACRGMNLRYRMAYPELSTLLGSDMANANKVKRLPNLAQKRYQRQKRSLDCLVAFSFCLLSPLMILKQSTRRLLRHVPMVFAGKLTWVGGIDHQAKDDLLHPLHLGVLAHSSRHPNANIADQANDSYFTHWSVDWDLRVILRAARF